MSDFRGTKRTFFSGGGGGSGESWWCLSSQIGHSFIRAAVLHNSPSPLLNECEASATVFSLQTASRQLIVTSRRGGSGVKDSFARHCVKIFKNSCFKLALTWSKGEACEGCSASTKYFGRNVIEHKKNCWREIKELNMCRVSNRYQWPYIPSRLRCLNNYLVHE